MTSAPPQLQTKTRADIGSNSGSWGPAGRRLAWLSWAHLLGAGAYLIFLVVRFPRIASALYWNSDLAFASVLVDDMGATPGGVIKVGPAPHYTTIWYLYLTRSLPFRQAVWEITPLLLSIAGAGLIAWACCYAYGRWAGTLTLAIAVSANAAVAATTLPEGLRSHTWFVNAVLLAWLVFVAARDEPLRRRTKHLSVGVLGAISGATLASDPLFLVVGLGPLVAASLVLWLVRSSDQNKTILIMVGGVLSAAVVSALGTTILMDELGFRKIGNSGSQLAPGAMVVENLASFGINALYVTNGWFPDSVFRAERAGSVIMAGLVVLSSLAIIPVCLKVVRSVRKDSGTGSQARLAYTAFWVLSVVALALSYTFSDFAAGKSLVTARYVIPVFFAFAALAPAPFSADSGRKAVASVLAILFSALSVVSLERLQATQRQPAVKELLQASSFLQQTGLFRGYAPYWSSHALTYASGFRIGARPVMECLPNASGPEERYCRFYINVRSAWYRPQEGKKTFLIAGRSLEPPGIQAPALDYLGPPESSKRFGETHVFVYGYDIASKLRPVPKP